MNFSEFIGFIVTVLALIYMGYNQVRSEKAEPEDEVLKDEDAKVKDLLRSLDIDVGDEEAVPKLPPRAPPKPRNTVQKQLQTSREPPVAPVIQVVTTSHYDSIDDAGDMLNLPSLIPLEYNLPTAPSHIKGIAQDIGVRKMIIIHELISTPKGLLP